MATVEARPADPSRERHTLVNRHTGEQLELRRAVRDGAPCLELKGLLPPRQEGPPLHIHYQTHEEFNVTAGTLSVEVDGRQHRFEAGSTALLPAGSAHRWWNAGDETLVLEGTAWPVVDLDVYFVAAFEVLNSGPANRPPLFYMAHLAWRHRKTQTVLIGPRWVQAILVPAVVLVGTVLGRYRGTEWPGCPAHCSPAPVACEPGERRKPRSTARFA